MNLMMTRRVLLLTGASAALVPSVASAGLLGKDGAIFNRRGRAIRGTDPVAYFVDAKPVDGSRDITSEWMGATWFFASADNRSAFEAEPEAFAPQFGGYCAWAVSQNYTASTTPEAWKIVDGRLYLNYSKGIQRRWEGDIPGNIAKGQANWPALRDDLIA